MRTEPKTQTVKPACVMLDGETLTLLRSLQDEWPITQSNLILAALRSFRRLQSSEQADLIRELPGRRRTA